MRGAGAAMKLLHTGKVKEVYDAGPDELLFHFTDNISVFDKIIPSQIPRKGEVLCRISEHWFRECAKAGIASHFGKLETPTDMLVKKVQVIHDYAKLDAKTTNYLIPLEVICRHFVAGSLHDKVKKGAVKPDALGFPKGAAVPYGAKLPEPLIEFTTKLEKVDRPVDRAEALKISGLSEKELQGVEAAVLRIDELIARKVEARGLIHVDGKKEFAFDASRRLMVIDTFGTPDEDRFWDKKLYEKGEFVELSKEFVRQHYRATGYYDKLTEAREQQAPEPDIPALPGKVVAEVAKLYAGIFERVTGETF